MVYRDIIAMEKVDEDDVFCVVAPGSESFTLANGVITSNCSLCSRPDACPIREQAGVPASEDDARKLAGEWIVLAERRTRITPMLKGYVDANGPVEVPHARGRRFVGWDVHPDGKRNFGVFEPRETFSPYDKQLEDAARKGGVLE
jgi:hypothetical protein